MNYLYPTILRRYLATFIDGTLVILVFVSVSYLFQQDSNVLARVRIGTIVFMFFIYEPLFTSKLCTLGQRITGIRIRKHLASHERISLPAAYVRIIVKVTLGLISFFTIPVTKGRRAIHDFAVSSVLIYQKLQLAC